MHPDDVPTDLFALDQLPGYSGVEAEIDFVDPVRVRFRATNADRHQSMWSGWFDADHCPIHLRWDSFEWPRMTLRRRFERRLCRLGLHAWVPTDEPHVYRCSRPACLARSGGHP